MRDWFERSQGLSTIAVAAVVVCGSVAVPRSEGPIELTVTGRYSAHPSMAATGRFAAIAWGGATNEGATDIYVAVSRDAGRTFGRPTRVSEATSSASLSGEQPPRVALVPRAGRDPSLVAVWTAKAAAGTRLISARSDDGGRSFTRPTPLPGSDAPGNRGWEATATDSEGHVDAIWLDHRELVTRKQGPAAANQGAHDHAAHGAKHPDGAERAELSKLFFARLDDATSPRPLTGSVCYCCKTSIATGPRGLIYAAWRHVYPGNVRDIAFTASRDGGRTFAAPIRVSEDRWVLDGCPENGPALTVDETGVVHVLWPTLVSGPNPASEPTLALFYAMSRDAHRFTPRQQIPTDGVPRHPQIAPVGHDAVVAAWDEQLNGTRRVVAAIGKSDGRPDIRFTRIPLGGSERAEYPVVASLDDGVLVAWTSGVPTQSVIRIERLALRQ